MGTITQPLMLDQKRMEKSILSMGRQKSTNLVRQRKLPAQQMHLTWGAWQLFLCLYVKYSKIWNLLMPHLLAWHQGERRGCSFGTGIPQGQAAHDKGLSSMWAGLQELPPSQARKRADFPSLSCQSLAPTLNQSSSIRVSQSTQRPLQGWSLHHPHYCPKYWKFVNLLITGNDCDYKKLERAQVMWEKRRKNNKAAPSPSKVSWQTRPCFGGQNWSQKWSPAQCCCHWCHCRPFSRSWVTQDRAQSTWASALKALTSNLLMPKEELIWNQLNLSLLPLPLKGS